MYNKYAKLNQAGNMVISGNEGRKYALSTYNAFMNFMNTLVTGQDYSAHKTALKNCLENMFVAEDGETLDSERFVQIMLCKVASFRKSEGQFKCIALSEFKKTIADPATYLGCGMSNYTQVEIKDAPAKSSGKKSAEQKLLESLGCTMEELKQAIASMKQVA